MKIGIYDPSWGELICGAHMYVGKMGEVLAARGHDVTFVVNGERFPDSKLAEAYGLDFSRIHFRPAPAEQSRGEERPSRLARYLGRSSEWRELTGPYDLFILGTSGEVPPVSHASRSILVVNFPCVSYETYHGYMTESWRRQPAPVRALRRYYHEWKWNKAFSSYSRVIANSQFTREWIRRRWRVDSVVSSPPPRPVGPPSVTKVPLILGLGRFMPDKKHGILIDSFKQMCDRGLEGWRLALIGGSSRQGEVDPYLSELKCSARGYPIEILTDLPGHELNRRISEASLFWHAKGFGEDEEVNPQEFEHFGIATVEAMAAGCVPLVYRGGGQVEIVRHGIDGLLWESADELIEQTSSLIRDEVPKEKCSRDPPWNARRDSRGVPSKNRLLETITPLLQGETPSRTFGLPVRVPGLASSLIRSKKSSVGTQPSSRPLRVFA